MGGGELSARGGHCRDDVRQCLEVSPECIAESVEQLLAHLRYGDVVGAWRRRPWGQPEAETFGESCLPVCGRYEARRFAYAAAAFVPFLCFRVEVFALAGPLDVLPVRHRVGGRQR